MIHKQLGTALSAITLALLLSSQAFGLNVTALTPGDYQTAALTQGISYYTDSAYTITSIPLALSGGTLIRTEQADASNPGLVVSFNVDVRAEVYVCYDSRAAAPSWLSSWVNTGMNVGVSNGTVGTYKVYAKRFNAGTVQLSANQASAMYFAVVKASVPTLPHKGWVLLTYDMNYLRDIIKKAPEYDVNHIQISHDAIMNTYEVLEDATRRANVNELIDLAHAYGVPMVTLWVHEVCTHGMPSQYYAPDGRSDGNNPGFWLWMKQRYTNLFTPGVGCPEADGVVLTFSEVDDNVYKSDEFKYDGFTAAEAVAKVVNTIQQVCGPLGKTLFTRTWVGFDKYAEDDIRDGILINGDPLVWMMNKNVGGIDWPNMDTHHAMMGTLPPQYNELIEFDMGCEYFGKNACTGNLTYYLKDHWNYCLDRNVDGAVARIDRAGGYAYYSTNRLNMYAFKRILADRNINPLAVNLEWCRQYFPLDIAQDISDHYDDPYSQWDGDTRYLMWTAYTSYSTLTPSEALAIGYAAIDRVDAHREVLEQQMTLDTFNGRNDFRVLHDAVANGISKLGGVVPDSTAPSVPTNVSATALTTTSVRVAWTASTDNVAVTGYRIYRNGSLAGSSTTSPYTDTGLTQNTTYSYTVLAYDAKLNKSAQSSPPATAKTIAGDSQPPGAPTNVQATALSAGSAQVTWTAATDNVGIGGYKIYRNGAQVGISTTTSYTNNGLQPLTTYSYTVSAYDQDGNNSAQSAPPVTVTTPVDTHAPSVPSNVAAAIQSATSVRVTWTASTDDVGVAGYNVFRDGNYVGMAWGTSYINTGLTSGVTYSYTVSAYDASGNESARSSPPVTVAATNCASVDLGSTNVNFTLAHVLNSDGDTVSTTAGGLDCRKPVKSGDNYYYFVIDDGFLYNTDVTTYLEVNYYDDQTSSVYLQPQYDAVGDGIPNMYRSASSLYFTNTSKWKTATWTLTNCKFANRQNVGADFRVYVGTGYNVKIDSVRLSKIPFSDYISVERDLGSTEIYKGLSHPQYSDGDTVVATMIGGRDCRKCSTTGDYYMYFNVSDAIIYDGSSPTVYLRVCYYDSPGGLIQPRYDSTTSEYTNAATVNFTGTNTWKEATWELTNCRFANSQAVSADFSLYLGTSQNIYIDKVTVSKMPFEDTVAPSIPTNVQATALTPTQIKVTWTASTDLFGVTGYKIFRNGDQIATSATPSYSDIGLTPNTTYSYTVSAYDAAGNNSAQSSPPAVATTMNPIDIAAAKRLPNTSSVGLATKVVTAVFSDCFYIEESDRYAGIKVVPIQMPAGLSTDKTVDVGGTMMTGGNGERYIGAATAMPNGEGRVVPLSMPTRSIGGGDWFYNPSTGAGQKSVKAWRLVKEPGGSYAWDLGDVAGMNNIGLLIISQGWVVHTLADGFYFDDGSGFNDGNPAVPGVKVWVPTSVTIPEEGTYVVVTGISSCYKPDSGDDMYRLIAALSITPL